MANKKITDLSAATQLTGDDLFPVVDAPGGTATTKKVTADVAGAYLNGVGFKVAVGLEWQSNAYANLAPTAGFVQNYLYVWPTWCPETMTISNVRFRMNTGAPASTTWRLGVYTDVDGTPTALITDFGTVDVTASGIKNISGLSTVLPYGRVWVGVCMQGTASTGGTYFQGVNNPVPVPAAGYGGAYTVLAQSGVTGALPATFAGANAASLQQICVMFQRSA